MAEPAPSPRRRGSVAIAQADVGGVGVVTLRAVAHRAAVPLAEARRTFGSRDRLVAAMVQRILPPGRPTAARAHGQLQSPAQTLTRLAEDEWAAHQANPWLVVVLASSRPPLVPAVLDAARACASTAPAHDAATRGSTRTAAAR